MSSSTNLFPVRPGSLLCSWPCSSVRSFVDRENMTWCRVSGLEEVFDKIDTIFSVMEIVNLCLFSYHDI